MTRYGKRLQGGDLRSTGQSDRVASGIRDQQSFDELASELANPDRVVAMRAADAIEKVTRHRPEFLLPHRQKLFSLCHSSRPVEIRWHLAQILPRLRPQGTELKSCWRWLTQLSTDAHESRIVRVNALQALFELSLQHPAQMRNFKVLLTKLREVPVPSLQARIRKISRELPPE